MANANNEPIGTSNDNNPLNQKRRGDNPLLDAQVFVPRILKAFQRARRASDTSPLGALAHYPRIAEAVDRLDDWDFSTPGHPGGVRPLRSARAGPRRDPEQRGRHESTGLRGQVVQRVIDGTLASVSLGDFCPDGDVALADLRPPGDLPPDPGPRRLGSPVLHRPRAAANPSQARNLALLESLDAASTRSPAAPGLRVGLRKLHGPGRLPLGQAPPHRLQPSAGRGVQHPPRGGPQHLRRACREWPAPAASAWRIPPGTTFRADSVNEFMFGGGPARRFIGEMTPQGPVAEEVIPGGESGVPGSPFQVDQLSSG